MQSNDYFEVEERGDVTIVRILLGKILDERDIQSMGRQLFNLVEVQRASRVLLVFAAVTFLSSCFLGKLYTLEKKVKKIGAKLVLCRISPEMSEVFDITRLNRFFDIRITEEEGLGALAS
jgi:anti-sigma B factor antagonist